ncbi:MAG: FecR domain-containing protein [Steroidobacteraceae bacterium]
MTDKKDNPIDEVAARWAARCDRAPLSAQERQELEDWLSRDIRHRGAFARTQALMHSLDQAQAVTPAHIAALAGDEVDRSFSINRRRFLWATAASGAVIGIGAWGLLAGDKVYATALGEVRRIPLSDGTVVTLNTLSELRVGYSSRFRMLQLRDGEAFFEIAPTDARECVLQVDGVSLRSTGAKLAVYRSSRQTEVLVRSGQVHLSTSGGAMLELPANTAGYVIDGVATSAALSNEEIDRRLAWRYGNIVFESQTLLQAVEEYKRYSTQPIIIDDARIADRRIVGLFAANDPAGFAQAIGDALQLTVTTAEDGIHISQ